MLVLDDRQKTKFDAIGNFVKDTSSGTVSFDIDLSQEECFKWITQKIEAYMRNVPWLKEEIRNSDFDTLSSSMNYVAIRTVVDNCLYSIICEALNLAQVWITPFFNNPLRPTEDNLTRTVKKALDEMFKAFKLVDFCNGTRAWKSLLIYKQCHAMKVSFRAEISHASGPYYNAMNPIVVFKPEMDLLATA